MSEKHNPDNDIPKEDAAPFEEDTPADAVILSERSESKDLTAPSVILSEAKDPTPQAESLPEEGDSSGEALGMTAVPEDAAAPAAAAPFEEEAPAAGGAPSDEGAVEDGAPSETEGGIPAPAADAVILSPQGDGSPAGSSRAEEEAPAAGGAPSDEGAVEDGSPSETEGGIPADAADAVILSEAKDPTPQAESLPEEGDSSSEALPPRNDSDGTAPAPAPKKPKKSIFRRVFEIVGYTVVVGMMVLVAFILFSNMSGKVTFIFGRTAMWVKTESMAPVIPERSYILVRKAAASEVRTGDVIVFKSDDPSIAGAYNTHRVVEILNGGAEFVTKGDNNIIQDQYTAKAANVLGIYEKNLPLMTSFGRVLSTTRGIMITFTMIFVIFLIIYVPDMTRAAKRKQEEADRIEQERVDALVALEVEKLKAEAARKAAEAAAPPAEEQKDTE
ncbi:MAG: signal peptidase I [Clostridia bacterium]|nr:signal peptidase I [Clostridia bacterium]